MFYKSFTFLTSLIIYTDLSKIICPNVKTNSYLCNFVCFGKTISNTKFNIMKQTNFNSGSRTYESPAVNVLDVMSEGVLCASNGVDIKDWETDDEILDF